MNRFRRLLPIAFIATAILALPACDQLTTDDDGDGDLSAVAGSYTLATVDGNALPHEITDGAGSMIVNAGSLTLTADGGYTASVTGQDSASADTWTDTFTGTFSVDGTSITLTQANDFYPQPGSVETDAVVIPLGNNATGDVTWEFRFER